MNHPGAHVLTPLPLLNCGDAAGGCHIRRCSTQSRPASCTTCALTSLLTTQPPPTTRTSSLSPTSWPPSSASASASLKAYGQASAESRWHDGRSRLRPIGRPTPTWHRVARWGRRSHASIASRTLSWVGRATLTLGSRSLFKARVLLDRMVNNATPLLTCCSSLHADRHAALIGDRDQCANSL